MLPVSTPGLSLSGGYPSTPHQVMKVFTVTIIDERPGSRDSGRRQLLAAQHQRTTLYDRFARAITSAVPSTIDFRI
jgi:hypothetical protein